ncbi:MAG: SulP family inorganic anion transporter, partial [Myxococcales bacterium]|nr:SulP family inorganic anion transporter [Myxococcales bacterium]
RVAAGVAALILIPILLLGGSLVAALPQASLAGVLLVTAMGMVDLRRLRRMWRASPITRGLLITTFFATLLLPLEWAIFLGVGLGVAQHLAAGRRPRVLLLEPCPDAHACRLVPTRREDAGSVVVIEVSGDCHFAAASTLRELVIAALPERARHVVIDLSHARALRYAALMSLERLDARVRERGGELQLTGVAPTFMRLLESTGSSLRARPFDPEPLASTRRALAELRARAEGDAPASEPREQNTP